MGWSHGLKNESSGSRSAAKRPVNGRRRARTPDLVWESDPQSVLLGMLNGGGCYGPRWRDSSGKEELFCILGVWATDKEGKPVFDSSMLSTVAHEFCHSYANPIIDRHQGRLNAAGDKLFEPVADQMRSQAYANGHTLLCESLVRASVVRYVRASQWGKSGGAGDLGTTGARL